MKKILLLVSILLLATFFVGCAAVTDSFGEKKEDVLVERSFEGSPPYYHSESILDTELTGDTVTIKNTIYSTQVFGVAKFNEEISEDGAKHMESLAKATVCGGKKATKTVGGIEMDMNIYYLCFNKRPISLEELFYTMENVRAMGGVDSVYALDKFIPRELDAA